MMSAAMPRVQTTPTEASALLAALLERRVDGELPALSSATDILELRAHLGRLPLAEVLPLHLRALFASGSLTPVAREQAAWSREDFFDELGAALGVSGRVMLAAVRARSFPLVPPRVLVGYEYLGSFTSSGQFDVADPCHLRKTSQMPAEIFSLSCAVEVERGAWHAFVRAGHGDDADRTAELAVIHAGGFDAVAAQQIATIGVDAGVAGVFDRNCPEPTMTELQVEGVVQGLGAFARSGYGDGMYPVFAGKTHGLVTKLRLGFLDERPEVDKTVPRRPGKRYANSATFEIGDTIEHPKFGSGSVMRVFDGKIEVEFDEDIRTLVHGKR